MLAFASAVIIGSESLGTSDHILLSQIRDFLFVASYVSEGYGGGIRHRLHKGSFSNHARINIRELTASKGSIAVLLECVVSETVC
jgi:hypothetical protein